MITIIIHKTPKQNLHKIGERLSKDKVSYAHKWIGSPNEHLSVGCSVAKGLEILALLKKN